MFIAQYDTFTHFLISSEIQISWNMPVYTLIFIGNQMYMFPSPPGDVGEVKHLANILIENKQDCKIKYRVNT